MECFLSVDRSGPTFWADTLPPVVSQLLERGEACVLRGDHRHAATFFEAAIAAAADRTPEPRVVYALFLADSENEAAAEAQLLEAWNLARRLSSREGRALVCYNLAVLCGRRGDRVRARQFQQLALAAWLEAEMPEVLPLWLRRLSAAEWLRDNEPEAERLLSPFEAPLDAEQWFDAADRAADPEGAIDRLERAALAAREDGDSFGEALACEMLATVWRSLRRWHEAAEALRQAERLHDGARRFQARHRCRRQYEELRSLRATLDRDPNRN